MRIVCVGIVLLVASVARGQECPVQHPALTGLDHAAMLAAYTASFEGLYHRAPSLQPGSGVDDGEYWIAQSNHYGMFSDGVCRAGWSRYWEDKLAGTDSAPPSDGDLPAKYQPGGSTPTPPPAPPPVPDLTPRVAALEAAVAALQSQLATDEATASQLAATVQQGVVGITTRLNALEARPIITGCTAAINVGVRVPISCKVQ